MIFMSILIFIVAMALPSFVSSFVNQTNVTNISSILFPIIRGLIILIYAGALSFNAFYIQSIGSGIGNFEPLLSLFIIPICYSNNKNPKGFNNPFKNSNPSFFSLFHTQSILYSDRNELLSRVLEESDIIASVTLNNSNSSLVPYSKLELATSSENPLENISSYGESFPWFVIDEGRPLPYDKPLRLFEGIKRMSRLLETRFVVDTKEIPTSILQELINLFKEESDIPKTILDLYDFVTRTFNKDPQGYLKKAIETLSIVGERSVIINEGTTTMDSTDNKNFNLDPDKLLGQLGDYTLNPAVHFLKDFKFEPYPGKVSIHAAPALGLFVSAGILLKSYVIYVYNRPFDPQFTLEKIRLERIIRNRILGIFFLIGITVSLFMLSNSAITLKDVITIDMQIDTNSPVNQYSLNQSSLLLFLAQFNQKIPKIVKKLFKFFFFFIVVLKLQGITFLTLFYLFFKYIKVYLYIMTSFALFYQIISLYFLHLFSRKKVEIPQILPEFLISWLREFEIMTSSPKVLNGFKKEFYIHFSIFFAMLILVIIIT